MGDRDWACGAILSDHENICDSENIREQICPWPGQSRRVLSTSYDALEGAN